MKLCSFLEPGSTDSPDRLDALVWGLTDLMLGGYQEITSFHVPVVASRPRGNFDAPFVSAADGAYSDHFDASGGLAGGQSGGRSVRLFKLESETTMTEAYNQ